MPPRTNCLYSKTGQYNATFSQGLIALQLVRVPSILDTTAFTSPSCHCRLYSPSLNMYGFRRSGNEHHHKVSYEINKSGLVCYAEITCRTPTVSAVLDLNMLFASLFEQ